MSNIFSKCKDQKEEPYVRPSVFKLTRTESIDSNATAPNIPGPGRNLGLLFDAIGGKIERLLNNLASRRRLGPQAIFEDIRSLRRYEDWRHCTIVTPTDEEYHVYKKLCRRLLKYCKSHVLATQMEALEAVTTLAIEDPYVRQVLAGILHTSYLVPKYNERELHIASSKALISIKDNEVHEFWMHLQHSEYTEKESEYYTLRKRCITYLRDPDISFLLARLFSSSRSTPLLVLDTYPFIREAYFDIATKTPHLIEPATCIKSFEIVERHWNSPPADLVMRLARHFPVLRIYQQISASGQKLQMDGPMELEEISGSSVFILHFLKRLCRSSDPREQLLVIHNMDENMQKLFQGTVFRNDVLIIWAHVVYNGIYCFTSYETEFTLLFNYYLQHYGNPVEGALAKTVICRAMGFNRYFKHAMFKLVSQCNDMPLEDMIFEELSGPLKLGLHSHSSCYHDYGYDPICRGVFVENINIVYREDASMREAYTLARSRCSECFHRLFVWFDFDGRVQPFNARGHFPVLAGFDAFGKEMFVARNYETSFLTAYFYISDGAKNASILDRNGEVGLFTRFEVLVLRHDPCDVVVPDIPADAKFQTGPAYWIRKEKRVFERDLYPFSWREYRKRNGIEDCSGSSGRDLGSSENARDDGFEDTTSSEVIPASKKNTGEGPAPEQVETDGVREAVLADVTSVEGKEDHEGLGVADAMEEMQRDRRLLEEEERELEARQEALKKRRRELEERERALGLVDGRATDGSGVD